MKMYYNKNVVRNLTKCPRCGSDVGVPCFGTQGLRKSNHHERVKSYEAQIGAYEPSDIRSTFQDVDGWITHR